MAKSSQPKEDTGKVKHHFVSLIVGAGLMLAFCAFICTLIVNQCNGTIAQMQVTVDFFKGKCDELEKESTTFKEDHVNVQRLDLELHDAKLQLQSRDSELNGLQKEVSEAVDLRKQMNVLSVEDTKTIAENVSLRKELASMQEARTSAKSASGQSDFSARLDEFQDKLENMETRLTLAESAQITSSAFKNLYTSGSIGADIDLEANHADPNKIDFIGSRIWQSPIGGLSNSKSLDMPKSLTDIIHDESLNHITDVSKPLFSIDMFDPTNGSVLISPH